MNNQQKNRLLFLIFTVVTGAIIGVILWMFLKIMSIANQWLWVILPNLLHIPYYTIIVCVIGGLIIGRVQQCFGPQPENMEAVMATLKRDGHYPYDHMGRRCVAALLPIIFGGSIGPEAGMTGIIVGLCCWAGDRFKYMGKNLRDLTQIGISATLGAIFQSPLFGLMMPLESGESNGTIEFPKKQKIIIYLAAILGCVGVIALLNSLLGGGLGMPHLSGTSIGQKERLLGIPLAVVGVAFGLIYYISHKVSKQCFEKIQVYANPMVSAIIGGLIIGVIGQWIPLAMFSGEAQMEVMAETYMEYLPIALLGLAIVKLILTNISIQSGWRGGHFFPVIFAGVCAGYGCGLLLGIEPVFAVATITAGLMGYIMRKPIAVSMILLLCFPVDCIIWMIVAAAIGSAVPVPKILAE